MLPKVGAMLTTVTCSGSVSLTIGSLIKPTLRSGYAQLASVPFRTGYWLLATGYFPLRYLFRPPLDNRFHLRRKLIRQRPIDQAMIEGQRQVRDGPDRNRIVDHHRRFL